MQHPPEWPKPLPFPFTLIWTSDVGQLQKKLRGTISTQGALLFSTAIVDEDHPLLSLSRFCVIFRLQFFLFAEKYLANVNLILHHSGFLSAKFHSKIFNKEIVIFPIDSLNKTYFNPHMIVQKSERFIHFPSKAHNVFFRSKERISISRLQKWPEKFNFSQKIMFFLIFFN